MKSIYFNHDANTDDFTSLFFLTQIKDIHLAGVSVIPADGYLMPGVSASRKILQRFGTFPDTAVAASSSRPEHPFPNAWREFSFHMDAMPMLNDFTASTANQTDLDAYQHLIQCVQQNPEKTTLLFTGPLTDLARALDEDPSIEDKIECLYWMGGTLLEEGNVIDFEHDGSAEWNAFWDSAAVKRVFASSLRIIMIGLESTNQVPLTPQLRQSWAKERQWVGVEFLGQAYMMVPPLQFKENNSTYYFWDVLTTLSCFYPELVHTKTLNVAVKTTYPSHGKIYETAEGRPIELVDDVNAEGFYQTMIDLAKRAE